MSHTTGVLSPDRRIGDHTVLVSQPEAYGLKRDDLCLVRVDGVVVEGRVVDFTEAKAAVELPSC